MKEEELLEQARRGENAARTELVMRHGRRLAWAGIILALTALVVAVIAGLLHLAPAGPDFSSTTD